MEPTYQLRVLGSDVEGLVGQRFELAESRYAFGRAEGVGGFYLNDYRAIYVRSNGVSRVHATLEKRDGAWWIADEQSHAGTNVNGDRIDGPRALKVGDRFTLFKTTFELATT